MEVLTSPLYLVAKAGGEESKQRLVQGRLVPSAPTELDTSPLVSTPVHVHSSHQQITGI